MKQTLQQGFSSRSRLLLQILGLSLEALLLLMAGAEAVFEQWLMMYL